MGDALGRIGILPQQWRITWKGKVGACRDCIGHVL